MTTGGAMKIKSSCAYKIGKPINKKILTILILRDISNDVCQNDLSASGQIITATKQQ
jgi:hypothetical protein